MATWKPISGWNSLWRGGFETEHAGSHWVLGVNYVDLDEKLKLYRDGELVRTVETKGSFDLPGGARIEAALATYGMKYVRLVAPDGTRPLDPVPGTGEKWRADLHRDRPTLSRVIGVVALLVVLFGAVTQVPEILNVLLNVADSLSDDVGYGAVTWRLPTLALPGWANVSIGVIAVIAALERALALRHIPGIDE